MINMKVLTNDIKFICKSRKEILDIALCGLLGCIIFFLLYGFNTINVTYDDWILYGYAEDDIINHYAGWIAFRNSEWSWPLGKMDAFRNTLVSFTDSIPWVSIFFKIFRNILPDTFQFFGLYVLICFLLQGISSGMIIKIFNKDNKWILFGGTVLFCVSPIMIERAFRHTALASHWLILFALYLMFNSRKKHKLSWGYCLLSALAIGIHPYFLPMIYAIMLINIIELWIYSHSSVRKTVPILCSSIIITLVLGFGIGALGQGSLGGEGYGYYSMNLNAVINPMSLGGFVWSRLLKKLPQILGNIDGFNYLGLGVILIVPFILIYLYKHRCIIKNNRILFSMGMFLVLFALSNVITFNDKTILQYYLPQSVLNLCSIFRASSRMFYPVYYVILIMVIWYICRKPYKNILIWVIVLVQLWDISPALCQKRIMFEKEYVNDQLENNVFYNSEVWESVMNDFDSIKMLNDGVNNELRLLSISKGIKLDVSLGARTYKNGLKEIYTKNFDEILNEKGNNGTIYLTNNENIRLHLMCFLPASMKMYDLPGGYTAVVSNDRDICAAEATEIETTGTITVINFTDSGWNGGVYRHGERVLLFPYTILLESALKDLDSIYINNNIVKIEKYETKADYIWVWIGESNVELEDFQYPKKIRMGKRGIDTLEHAYILTNLTDQNWTKGYSNYSNTLLFEYNNKLLIEFLTKHSVVCNGEKFSIIGVDYDEMWIRVTVDRDASICEYPSAIVIE